MLACGCIPIYYPIHLISTDSHCIFLLLQHLDVDAVYALSEHYKPLLFSLFVFVVCPCSAFYYLNIYINNYFSLLSKMDGQVIALLVQNLDRLDENVKEDSDGVHNTLGKSLY